MDRMNILCYGDSNTWGLIPRWKKDPLPARRYDEGTRWTQVAQKCLGEGYHLIEEGLAGRTTIYGEDGEEWKNGKSYLKPCMMSHRQLDMVILMLGTNDLSLPFRLREDQLGDGIRELIELIQELPRCGKNFEAAKILLVAPAEIREASPEGQTDLYQDFYGDWGRMLSLRFPEVYGRIANEYGCYFLNGALYACPSEADGIHLTPESHRRLGKAIAAKIKEIDKNPLHPV